MKARQVLGLMRLTAGLIALALPGCGPKITEGDCITPKNSNTEAYNGLADNFYGKPKPAGTVPDRLHCTAGRLGYVGKYDTVELKDCAVVDSKGNLVKGTFWGYENDFKPCDSEQDERQTPAELTNP